MNALSIGALEAEGLRKKRKGQWGHGDDAESFQRRSVYGP